MCSSGLTDWAAYMRKELTDLLWVHLTAFYILTQAWLSWDQNNLLLPMCLSKRKCGQHSTTLKHNHVIFLKYKPKVLWWVLYIMNTAFYPFICNCMSIVSRKAKGGSFIPEPSTVMMKGAGNEHDTPVQILSTHVPLNKAVDPTTFEVNAWTVPCDMIVAESMLRQEQP